MTNPLANGAVNVPHHVDVTPPTDFGFDSAGIYDNYQATSDDPAIDRHII